MFARFTDRSRGCLDAAFEVARELGHDSLGDDDLLLGILRVNGGIAGDALSSMGVTFEAVCGESEAMLSEALASIGISFEEVRREAGEVFDMSLPEGRKIPYSPLAKNALVGARKEMRRLGDHHLGSEHVLIGILREDGTAVRILARLGVSPGALRDRIFEFRALEMG